MIECICVCHSHDHNTKGDQGMAKHGVMESQGPKTVEEWITSVVHKWGAADTHFAEDIRHALTAVAAKGFCNDHTYPKSGNPCILFYCSTCMRENLDAEHEAKDKAVKAAEERGGRSSHPSVHAEVPGCFSCESGAKFHQVATRYAIAAKVRALECTHLSCSQRGTEDQREIYKHDAGCPISIADMIAKGVSMD